MLHPPVTIPITFVRAMLLGAKSWGRPCDSFLHDAGIAPELLEQAGARVTVDQYVNLFRLLIEHLEDEFLGFLSRPVKHGSFALIARSGISANTLELAVRRIARTFWLLQDDVELRLVRQHSLAGLCLRFCDSSIARPDFLHELTLRVFWRLLAWVAGGKLPVVRFDFAFERPSYADSYSKIFPAPLSFGCQESGFWFDAGRLADPVRRDEAALRVFLAAAQANIIAPRRRDEVTSARVRSHLQNSRPEWADLVATAKALHMSAPTLQRRLAGEGTTFQSLKDELRRDCAIVRLNTSTVSLAALAYELGFADSSAFQRAFKSWTGTAPGSYSQRQAKEVQDGNSENLIPDRAQWPASRIDLTDG
jgi:AraC-like DNA-binding protein